MRNGLEHAIPALIAILVGVIVTAIAEGAHWAREAGVLLLDRDYPSTPLTPGEGAHDARRATLTWGLLLWLPGPARRRRRRPTPPRRHPFPNPAP